MLHSGVQVSLMHCSKAETGSFPLLCQAEEEKEESRALKLGEEMLEQPELIQLSKSQSFVKITSNLLNVNICCLHSPNSL